MLGLAPGGGCLAGRVATPPVVSYATFSPSPAEMQASLVGSLFLWSFSVGSPRLGVTQHRALWSSDFPHPAIAGRGRPAPLGKTILARRGCGVKTPIGLTFPPFAHTISPVVRPSQEETMLTLRLTQSADAQPDHYCAADKIEKTQGLIGEIEQAMRGK